MSQTAWRVEVSSEAQRGLRRLPAKVATAIVAFITGPLADNPHMLSKDLTAELAGYRSARRGDYRVVIKVVDAERVVLVHRVAHRAHVYRPR